MSISLYSIVLKEDRHIRKVERDFCCVLVTLQCPKRSRTEETVLAGSVPEGSAPKQFNSLITKALPH
jgi:hypothetical protein